MAERVQTFADGEASALRGALKAQQAAHAMKLETARTAGDMKLKNQAVELEANNVPKSLALQMRDLTSVSRLKCMQDQDENRTNNPQAG